MVCRVFISRRIYGTILTWKLSAYLPKSMSFAPAGTVLAVKLLSIPLGTQNATPSQNRDEARIATCTWSKCMLTIL